MAFQQGLADIDTCRFTPGRDPEPVVSSTFYEGFADFSPDARRIVFGSARSAERMEIWLASEDGSQAQQLTRGPGTWQDSAHWSPDGSRIAYDSRGEDGHWDIWMLAVDGGAPRRLTQNPGDDSRPSWSRDGSGVYYSSERGGSRDIFRISLESGEEEQVTRDGRSLEALESRDGRTLLIWMVI